MNSKLILLYYDWLRAVQIVVEDAVLQHAKDPHNPAIPSNTDDYHCRGFSLKGQAIEISSITGSVFIRADLLTFAHWLKQYELSIKEQK